MKQNVYTYHHTNRNPSTDFAGRLVTLMGYNDAIAVCIENQWSGTEKTIRRMRKDLIQH